VKSFFKPAKINKLKNIRHTCHQGHIHQSKLESGHCDKINLLLKAGEYSKVETQVSFPLYAWFGMAIGGDKVKICTHIVDKLVTLKDGSKQVIETKGFGTDIWALKKKLFEANYPEIKYLVWRKP
jgi:hypothetical protein